jgi:hypothetical protein
LDLSDSVRTGPAETGAVVTWFVTGFPDLTDESEVRYGSSNRRRLHERRAWRTRDRDRAIQLGRGGHWPGRLDSVRTPPPLFSRNQAITAMVLAERLAAGFGNDDPFVIGWREKLGL